MGKINQLKKSEQEKGGNWKKVEKFRPKKLK